MSVKVAINGFGRIGRLAFRQMFGAEGYEVVAINDLTAPTMLANLLKYDTAQKGYCGTIGENLHTVEAGENSIIVDGKEITIYAKPNAAELPWGELGIDVVLECTGFYCYRLLLLQGEEPGSHRRRRQEGRYLRSRGQGSSHRCIQRKRRRSHC